jgi:hypothetical protein
LRLLHGPTEAELSHVNHSFPPKTRFPFLGNYYTFFAIHMQANVDFI